jgi:hypothetical protein
MASNYNQGLPSGNYRDTYMQSGQAGWSQGADAPAGNIMSDIPTLLIAIFSILILLFLLGRFVMLWYWKINKMVSLLEKIESNTNKDEKKIEGQEEMKG